VGANPTNPGPRPAGACTRQAPAARDSLLAARRWHPRPPPLVGRSCGCGRELSAQNADLHKQPGLGEPRSSCMLVFFFFRNKHASLFVTEARKKKGGKLNDALTGSLRYVSKSSVNIQPGRPFKPRPYYFSYINPIETDDITC